MDKIWIIALNTFKESVRDKILYILVFAAVGLILFTLMIGQWAVFNQAYVTQSLSLSLTSFSGLAVAIFVGIGLVQKEIQKKTVLTLLAKPIPRGHFILGKYLGLMMVIGVHVLLMALVITMILMSGGYTINPMLYLAIALLYVEIALVTSVALLFSSFSTPVLSSLFTLGFYLAGHLSSDLMRQVALNKKLAGAGETGGELFTYFAKAVYYVFPNLDQYIITPYVVYEKALPSGLLLQTVGGGALYITLFLSVGIWWFSRRDFV